MVKSFNHEDNEQKRFNEVSDELNLVLLKIGYLFSIIVPAFMFIGQGLMVVAIYFVGNMVGSEPKDGLQITDSANYLSSHHAIYHYWWNDDICSAWICFQWVVFRNYEYGT